MAAEVIDIRKAPTIKDKRILFDTNILYFIYYDKYTSYEILHARSSDYKLKFYEKFYKKLLDSHIDLYICKTNLYQFINLIEDSELKILYSERSGSSQVRGSWKLKKKHYRDAFEEEWRKIQKNVWSYCEKMKKGFNVLESKLSFKDKFNYVFSEWKNSKAGFFDALIVSEAKENGINAFLSDDADFASFERITLYTANNLIIDSD